MCGWVQFVFLNPCSAFQWTLVQGTRKAQLQCFGAAGSMLGTDIFGVGHLQQPDSAKVSLIGVYQRGL